MMLTDPATTEGDNVPAHSPDTPKLWEQFLQLISAGWDCALDHTLVTAKHCADAARSLSPSDLTLLRQRLPPKLDFSKMKKIGEDTRLYEPRIRARLPSCYTKLWELTFLSDDCLNRALESGLLHPAVPRDELRDLREKRPYKRRAQLLFDEDELPQPAQAAAVGSGGAAIKQSAASQPAKPAVFGEVRLPADYPEERRAPLLEEMRRIEVTYGVTFLPRQTPQERAEQRYDKAMNSFNARWLKAGRMLVRRRVKSLKKSKLKGCEKWPSWSKKMKWGLGWDETHIDLNSGWDEMWEVLDNMGIDDEYDLIYARAEQLAKAPELPSELDTVSGADPVSAAGLKRTAHAKKYADWK